MIDGCTPAQGSFNEGECYEDTKNRTLPYYAGKYNDNQLSRCNVACKGFKYAGMENTKECWCGDIPPAETLQRTEECPEICPGNPDENCGGEWRMNVFEVTGNLIFL